MKLFLAVALAVVIASPAGAQTFDHLKCFKVKDAKTFKRASADLTITGGHLAGLENCQIKPKAKEFCIPVDKSNVVVVEGAETPVAGEEHQFDRLCYKVKCPKVDVPGQAYSDQFGNRTLEKFKVSTLCTPAVKGPVPGPEWPATPQDYTFGEASYINSLTVPPIEFSVPTCCKDFGAISRDKIVNNTNNIDNALAMLADTLAGFGIDLQASLDDAIANGDLVMLLDHQDLDPLALPDQFVLVQFLGAFGLGTDFTLADQGLGTFLANESSFVPGTGEPLNFAHPASMSVSSMSAGPFSLAISLPLGFLSLGVTAEGAEAAADHGLITPAGVPYSNGALSGYVLVEDIYGALNDILNAPGCACLGHTEDIYQQQLDGSWLGICVTGASSLCPDPEEEICATLAGNNLFGTPPEVCGILPSLLESQSDIDLNADPALYEGMSVGLEFTAVEGQIIGVQP